MDGLPLLERRFMCCAVLAHVEVAVLPEASGQPLKPGPRPAWKDCSHTTRNPTACALLHGLSHSRCGASEEAVPRPQIQALWGSRVYGEVAKTTASRGDLEGVTRKAGGGQGLEARLRTNSAEVGWRMHECLY